MSAKLNWPAWQKLLEENVEWLRRQPRTLERDHLIMLVTQARVRYTTRNRSPGLPHDPPTQKERETTMSDEEYEVGADPDEDMSVMLEAADADLADARADNVEMRAYATRLEAALVRAHACPTVRDDGTCDGCYISEVLATCPEPTP